MVLTHSVLSHGNEGVIREGVFWLWSYCGSRGKLLPLI